MPRTFLGRRRSLATSSPVVEPGSGHALNSDFIAARCRFVVDCTCGARMETRYIDEALEWRELHEVLGPLEDEFSA